MDILDGLNDEQKAAVTHGEGPLSIVAGAGTGKTTVITKRLAWLVESGKAKTDHILALTFTDKAAGEMEERLDKLLPYGYTDLAVSTFHAFAEKLLHGHALDIGVPYDFKLLNQTEQWLLVRKHLKKFNLNYYRPLGNPTKFIHALLRHFSRAKDEEIYPEDYLRYAESLRLNRDTEKPSKAKRKKKTVVPDEGNEAARIEEVAGAYHTYQQILLEETALDFGDLINYLLKLFRTRPDVLARYREQFKYVLVDEFQDTNWAQYELVKLIAAPANNLTVVGDDDQSIYRFRGASMSNILQFNKDFPKAQQVVLSQNYRSTQPILDLAHAFIQHNNPNRLEVQQGLKKVLLSAGAVKTVETTIEHIHGVTLDDEQQLIVQKILTLKKNDPELNWGDIAVLARSNDQANALDFALARAGVPHQSYTQRGLYSKSVIVDALSYLRLLDNYHESTALWRVLNFPLWELSPRDVIELSHFASKKSKSLFEALEQSAAVSTISDGARPHFARLLKFINEHALFARDHKPTELFVKALNDIGYTKWVEVQGEEKARQEFSYLNQFYQRLKRWEDSQSDPRLHDFLDVITYEIESGEEGSLSLDPEVGPDVVRVMTVHAAKGLEFAYVFIIGLVDRRFPTSERGEPIQLPEALVKEVVPEGNNHLEEERRLFYVAMTRAKRGLFFTSAEDYGGARKKKLSQFLVELDIPFSPPLTVGRAKLGLSGSIIAEQPTTEQSPDSSYIPTEFSFTQLKSFETCPFQYRFAHVLKVPVWGRHTFSFGTSMHAALERFFLLIVERRNATQEALFADQIAKPVVPTLDELMKIYEESWIDDWYDSKEHQQEYFNRGKQILKDFFAKHDGKWPDTKYLERGFKLKVGEHTIKGKIDRMDAVDGGMEIIDYKTGNVPKSESDVDKDQLLIYHMASEELWQETPVTLTFYYLNENKPISFRATPEDIAKIREKIRKTIDEIKKGEFPATPGPNKCKFCDFKDICEFRQV